MRANRALLGSERSARGCVLRAFDETYLGDSTSNDRLGVGVAVASGDESYGSSLLKNRASDQITISVRMRFVSIVYEGTNTVRMYENGSMTILVHH